MIIERIIVLSFFLIFLFFFRVTLCLLCELSFHHIFPFMLECRRKYLKIARREKRFSSDSCAVGPLTVIRIQGMEEWFHSVLLLQFFDTLVMSKSEMLHRIEIR